MMRSTKDTTRRGVMAAATRRGAAALVVVLPVALVAAGLLGEHEAERRDARPALSTDRAAPVGATSARPPVPALGPTRPLRLDLPPVGAALVYDLSFALRIRAVLDEGATQDSLVAVRGALRVRVVQVTADATWVACALLRPTFETATAAGSGQLYEGEQLAALSREALARLAPDGTVEELRFRADHPALLRSVLQASLGWLRPTLPRGAEATWEAVESDPAGRFLARYQVVASEGSRVRIERSKVRYLELELGDVGATGGAAPPRVEARLVATIDRAAGRVLDVEVEEEAGHAGLGPFEALTNQVQGRLTLTACDSTSAGSDDLMALQAALETAPAAEPALGIPVPAALRALSLVQLLERLERLMAGGGRGSEEAYDLFLALRAVFARDSALLEQARRILGDPGYGLETRGIVLSALGACDAPGAQTALVRAIGDLASEPALQVVALQATVQVARPGEELVRAVRGLAADRVVDPDVSGVALLALGALATRLSASDAEARGDDLTTYLRERLAGASSSAEASLAVAALGNDHSAAAAEQLWRVVQGRSSALSTLAPAEQLELRLAAVRAVSGSSRRDVRDGLVSLLQGEAQDELRGAAARGLALRTDAGDQDVLVRVALGDRSAAVRGVALRSLHDGRLAFPGAAGALARAALEDPDPSNRAFAQRVAG